MTEFESWELTQLYVPHVDAYLPLKHVYIIRKNWALGKPWWQCSPMFTLTRADIAYVVTADLPKQS